MREECLNENIFMNLTEAKRIIETWVEEYNLLRPHSSLGGLTPALFAERYYKNQMVKLSKQMVQ